MKKIISIIMAAALIFCFAGCTADGNESSGSAETGHAFVYNGTTVSMNAEAAPIVAALGEPKSYTEETSCAFTGLDKTYYYGSFYMTTYPSEEKDYVYTLWFADDSVSTAEGIYIGAAQSAVEAAYGTDSFNGSNAYTVTKGDSKLIIIVADGLVTSVQYEAVVE